MIKTKPLVSICCITYNHEKFIEEALEGFLMQETNFEYEILIHDDASTDKTKSIIESYVLKHPEVVFPIFQKENQYSLGVRGIMARYNFPRAKGKYVALCEGDDYWTDPLKLQKQVDFMEVNPSYGVCFHNTLQKSEFNHIENFVFPNVIKDTDFLLEDYVLSNITATCSMVFKSEFLKEVPSWFTKLPFGDLGITLTVMKNSNKKCHVLKDIMAVYRIHEQGTHGSFHKNNKGLLKAYKQHLQFNAIIAKNLLKEPKYKRVLLTKKRNTYKFLSKAYRNEQHYFLSIKNKCLMRFCNLLLRLRSLYLF
ncbi:glycosyltransferase family 2 protein [Aestuariivivens marinum]|uniref:glycosyltransferase family 2 protein n=1 Tax=Aestuariivivens marinum TaxID=2913555 RepID=UPI001F5AD384|nr:glycosyltransferase [Aestuariivivens marinum]